MNEQIDNEDINTQHSQYPYEVSVRFRNSEKSYSFGTKMADLKNGDKVVVETAQGTELGFCTADAVSTTAIAAKLPLKPVLRVADAQDIQDYEENIECADEAFKTCQQEIRDLGLQMNLLSAQYTLDRRRILFVYIAEQRVDFRELLKHLSSRLSCRIELRQIGERDKAKMVGGVGVCGMECCCSRFKTHFDTISINMAKNQLLALNIDKLSGQCGKLMCCLKYEDDDYKELTKGLPKMGAQIEYEGSIFRLTSMNVMCNQAKLENREAVEFITLEELKDKGILRKGVQQQRKPQTDASGKPVESKQRGKVVHHSAATGGNAQTPVNNSSNAAIKDMLSRRNDMAPDSFGISADKEKPAAEKKETRHIQRAENKNPNGQKQNTHNRNQNRNQGKNQNKSRVQNHVNHAKPETQSTGKKESRSFRAGSFNKGLVPQKGAGDKK